jgi:hypothetical protein
LRANGHDAAALAKVGKRGQDSDDRRPVVEVDEAGEVLPGCIVDGRQPKAAGQADDGVEPTQPLDRLQNAGSG